MLRLPCPWCGPRPETEFIYGEAVVERPADPSSLSDEVWTNYVYFRDNPKGWHKEMWFHRAGCHRWFTVERHTMSHEIRAAYPPGQAPARDADGDGDGEGGKV